MSSSGGFGSTQRQQKKQTSSLKLKKNGGKENQLPSSSQKAIKTALREKAKQYRPPVPGVAQKTLILKKKPDKLPPVAKPLSYLTNTHLYDQHWIKKQEKSFTRWLNYVLAPVDPFGNVLTVHSKTTSHLENLAFNETARDNVTSFSYFSQKRQILRWRKCCFLLFQSRPYMDVMERLEIEIESGRLTIKEECSPFTNVGTKNMLMKMFLSYNPIWLRLGLEIIFGEEIIVPSTCKTIEELSHIITSYIQSRLFSNPQITSVYYHPSIIGRYGQGYILCLLLQRMHHSKGDIQRIY
jgi:abnormal spindle-like microcephaly-associated protein